MKHTIATIGLLVGSMALGGAFAANIKTLEAIDNNTVYVVKRQGNTGTILGNLNYVEGEEVVQANNGVAATDPAAQWTLHYSEREKAYFLYNLGAEKFITGNSSSKAVFTDEAVSVTPIFLETAGYWVLDCGGYILGLPRAEKGAVIFADDVTKANYKDVGYCFIIADSPQRQLTDDEVNAIERKISAGRTAALERYKTFVEKAKKMEDKASEVKFAGNYQLWEMEEMLAHPSRYTLAQFEEAYNRAIVSRLPHWGEYYRLRNQSRPGSYQSNLTTVNANGQLKSETLKLPVFGKATGDHVDDLSLFQVESVGGDPWTVRLIASAPNWYVNCGSGNNSKAYAVSDPSNATSFSVETVTDYTRPFMLRFANAESSWITVSGNNELVAWNQKETAMRFWFERVSSISVRTDANGYLPLILPANVALPEGLQAWVVTSVRDGKAYLEEAKEGVGCKIPFIIKGEPETSYELPVYGPYVWYPTAMTGSCIKAEVGARQQIVSSANGITFAPVEAGEVAPGTAFVLTDDTTPLEIVMGADPESGIEEIEADSAADLFDLHGRHVKGTPAPGLYIDAASRKVIRVK